MTFGVGSGGQAGDLKADNVAGQNIYHGLSGEQFAKVLEKQGEFYISLVTGYEHLYKDVGQQIQVLRKEQEAQMRDLQIELGIYREGERNLREARQQQIDRRDRIVSRRLFWLLCACFLLALLEAAILIYIWRQG